MVAAMLTTRIGGTISSQVPVPGYAWAGELGRGRRVCFRPGVVMGKLGRRLRELDKDEFESFVYQYLVATYPGAGITKVEGTGGDSGIDSFSGLLTSGPNIWQSKHFPNRIKEPQKKQILKSIKAAFQENAPSVWTLCLPIDLRTAEHKWFQTKIVQEYGGPGRMRLLQAADFETELSHNRNLRDTFFPENLASEMLSIRKIVTSAAVHNDEEVGKVTTEFAQQYLSAKMEIEPRLQPVLSIGGRPEMRSVAKQPGWVMSISEGEQTLSYFARDLNAYNLDPITIRVDVAREDHIAVKDAVETGRPITLQPGKVLQLESSSPSLSGIFAGQDLSRVQVDFCPFLNEDLASRTVPLRFIAGTGFTAKELFYVPFRFVRAGQREVALLSRTELPIEIDITMRLPPERKATLHLRPVLPGAELVRLHQVIQFFQELERSGVIEVRSVDTDAIFLTDVTVSPGSVLNLTEPIKQVINDGALVSSFFKASLRLPHIVGKREAEDLHTLKLITSGEEFFDCHFGCVLIKNSGYRDRVLAMLNEGLTSIRLDHPEGWKTFEVFGERINPGQVSLVADNVELVNTEVVRNSYFAAEEGEAVSFQFSAKGPCRWLLTKVQPDQRTPFLRDGGSPRTH